MAVKNIEPAPLLAIESATLHQPVSISTVMAVEKSLNKTKVPGIKLHWSPLGLIVERKGKRAIIPAANVAVAVIQD